MEISFDGKNVPDDSLYQHGKAQQQMIGTLPTPFLEYIP